MKKDQGVQTRSANRESILIEKRGKRRTNIKKKRVRDAKTDDPRGGKKTKH